MTSVRGKSEDYSKRIISGLNGVSLYFYLLLSVSSLTCIALLTRKKKLSENAFQNIILFHLFLLFAVSLLYFAT